MTSSGDDPTASPLNYAHLKELFLELSEHDAAQCEIRLAEVTAQDPALGQLLRELLVVTQVESEFLETPANQLFSDLCEEVDLKTQKAPNEGQDLQQAIEKTLQDRGSKDLGPFRLIRLLHAGSEGGLYLAKDRQLNRLVALRLLTEQQLSRRSNRKRIMASSALAARIRHPHVAMVLGVFEFGELTAIAREWIQGQDLQKWARQQGTRQFDEILEIIGGILDGVKAMHDKGIVHGDIKPQNIIFRPESRSPVLVDFGMVSSQSHWVERKEIETASHSGKVADQKTTELVNSSAGQPVRQDSSFSGGTPHYMAPELFQKKRPSVRSDLFALGVVLYWLATDKFPYAGDDLVDLVENVSRGNYLTLEKERPDFPQEFCQLVERMLDPSPSRRPGNIAEVKEALRHWIKISSVTPARMTGRRRWMTEAALWSGSIATGSVSVLAIDRAKRQALINDVPPFLPEKATRLYFSASGENDADIKEVRGIEFGEFTHNWWGNLRLAYPAQANQWGWVDFRPIHLAAEADYSLVNLFIIKSPEADEPVDSELFARLSGQSRFQRVRRRKFQLYIWEVSRFWEKGGHIELRLGMKYRGSSVPLGTLPPIGLRTMRIQNWNLDPTIDRDLAGSVVGWKTEE